MKIDENIADVNDAKSFLPFCALICLEKLYTKIHDQEILFQIKSSASNNRWRIREATAFAFQAIGEKNFDELKQIFSRWMKSDLNNLEQRCVLVSLAHPNMA